MYTQDVREFAEGIGLLSLAELSYPSIRQFTEYFCIFEILGAPYTFHVCNPPVLLTDPCRLWVQPMH